MQILIKKQIIAARKRSKKMSPHEFWLAFLIAILFHPEASMAAARCERKCGDIDIPYPFGMTKGCYLDETFEIACNKSTGTAELVWSNLEWIKVDNISIPTHSLLFKNYDVLALSFNKSGESPSGHTFFLDFTGSHYYVSHTRNKFIAMGCDFYAYLIDEETKEFLGGCAPLCNREDVVPSPSSPCSDLHCCGINISKDVRNMTLGVDTMNTVAKSWANHCGFFDFVDKDYLQHNKIKFSSCDEYYTLPIRVEWTVGNTSCRKAKERGDCLCGHNTVCIDHTRGNEYVCKCRHGYNGNPYTPEGCKDVDECVDEKYNNNCPKNHRCINTEGSYFCLPNNRRQLLPVLLSSGIASGVGLLILTGIGFWGWRELKKIKERKMKEKFFKKNGGLLLQQQISSRRGSVLTELTLFKIEELEKATDKFSENRVLGKGGLGTVYKGMLSDGRIVAVKKANIIADSQVDQFINEVFILSQINHRNIVNLFGCCLETEVPLLVYECVSNGTLSHHLHDEPNISTISWEDRLRIAADVAGALAYLHSYASTAIFHRDIKSSNILLDENYKAVISDFGLSRSVSIDKTHLTTLVGGTFGYLDPEYFRSGQLNDKSDVYAFGVVIAEILTGQKAVSSTKDDKGLALRFRSAVKENCLFEILEERVASEAKKEEILAVAKLAKRCLKINARKRPSMKEVAAELEQLRKTKELPGHQESLPDPLSENSCSCSIDSEVEND